MSYSDDILKALNDPTQDEVWAKAKVIDLPNELAGYRRDDFGNVIQREAYGDRSSPYGWEMDHSIPLSLGGSDSLSNVRPLHWRANVQKSNMPIGQGLLSLLRR